MPGKAKTAHRATNTATGIVIGRSQAARPSAAVDPASQSSRLLSQAVNSRGSSNVRIAA